jgi:type IV pilus assembly protein PilM
MELSIMLRKNTSLGVDIGSTAIKVVEIENTGKGPVIINAGLSKPLTDNTVEAISEALIELVEEKKFRTKRAVTTVQSVSEGSSTVRRIFMEHANAGLKKSELKERVEWEATTRDYITFAPEEAVMDFHVLEEGTQDNIPGLWVFLVAVRRDLVKERVDILRSAGLVPVAVEIDFTAVLGLLSYMDLFPDDEDIVAINIGATKTSIGIIYHRQLAFYREVSVAGNHITSQIERRLRIQKQEAEEYKLTEELFERISDGAGDTWRAASPIESVIEERQGLWPQIRECVRYYEGNIPNANLSRVFFSGGASQLRNLDNFLSYRLTIPVENIHFLDHIPLANGSGSEIENQEPMFAAAVGLALKPFLS